MEYPPLADIVKEKWPQDVLDRAKELQEHIGSIGAYTHSKGVPFIRKSVAQFIEGAEPHIPRIPVRLELTHRPWPRTRRVPKRPRRYLPDGRRVRRRVTHPQRAHHA